MDTKSALRRRMVARRRSMDAAARQRASRRACRRLLDLPELATAGLVALYAATEHEIDPAPALPALAGRDVRVAFPRVHSHQLELVVSSSFADLRRGYEGLREPRGPALDLAAVDVVVVPGLAFERDGARLGRGGGHYDRLLAVLPAGTLRVGLCFACQVVAHVPVLDHDESVDALVTETASVRTGARDVA